MIDANNLTAEAVRARLREISMPEDVAGKTHFFQAFPGGYAEGDRFIAVNCAGVNLVATAFVALPWDEIEKLLASEIHEDRCCALRILVCRFQRAGKTRTLDPDAMYTVYKFYLSHLEGVNNWDLVDMSAHYIIGAVLLHESNREVIYELASSGNLWRERIAIISTFAFIRNNDFGDTFRLAERFLTHRHDLIHKAVGWMLREIGKRDREAETGFLRLHYRKMPRTMLRYSIEHFSPEQRQLYLKGLI